MKHVSAAIMQDLAARIFRAAGSSADEADTVAGHLVEASLMGHDSHGVIRIRKYIEWAKAGHVIPN